MERRIPVCCKISAVSEDLRLIEKPRQGEASLVVRYLDRLSLVMPHSGMFNLLGCFFFFFFLLPPHTSLNPVQALL